MMCVGSLSNVNPLKCISMNNQERKVRPEIVNVNSIFLLVLKHVNAVVAVMILIIHMQKFVYFYFVFVFFYIFIICIFVHYINLNVKVLKSNVKN